MNREESMSRAGRLIPKGSWGDLVKFTGERGLATLLQGAAIDYSRFLEYRIVYQKLALQPGLDLLDLGSGRHGWFPLWVVSRTNCVVHSTDIGDYVAAQLRNVEKLGLGSAVASGRLVIGRQDATALAYRDESFDRVSAISALEHIPEKGDMEACREIARVLRHGGKADITVPYNHELDAQVYMDRPEVYERRGDGLLWWCRIYNDDSLRQRLVEPSGLKLESIDYFGERTLPLGRYWYTSSSLFRKMIGGLSPLLSLLFLRLVSNTEIGMNAWLGSGAIIVLTKPREK